MKTKIINMLAFASAMVAPVSANADWSIIGLGGFIGDVPMTQATAINDKGVITVVSQFPYYIDSSNGYAVGQINSGDFAYGINNNNQIVGSGAPGFVYDVGFGGTISQIKSPLGTDKYISPRDINDKGSIVGFYHKNDLGLEGAFITDITGRDMRDIGSLGGTQSYASAINNTNRVTGWSSTADGEIHAFITFEYGYGMQSIGTLGGSVSQGFDINSNAQIVGASTFDDKYPLSSHAFVTGQDGENMVDLGTFGGRSSTAFALNDQSEVVGYAQTETGDYHAFLYSHGGMTDLDVLPAVLSSGWSSLTALDINNNGQIVGSGYHNGQLEAFLLSYTQYTVFDPQPIFIPAVPEPMTYAMLMAGLGLIGFMRQKLNGRN